MKRPSSPRNDRQEAAGSGNAVSQGTLLSAIRLEMIQALPVVIASVVKYLNRYSREGGNPEGWMPDESIRA